MKIDDRKYENVLMRIYLRSAPIRCNTAANIRLSYVVYVERT